MWNSVYKLFVLWIKCLGYFLIDLYLNQIHPYVSTFEFIILKKPFISVSYHTIKSILRSLSCWLDIWLNIYTCFMYRTSFPFRYWRIIKLSTISEHKPNNEHISQYVAFVEEVCWLRKLCYHLPNISFGRFFSWTGLVIKLSVLECTFL